MTRSVPWPRILAEGFAIVVSILLAFGIQAWWEGRGEALRREALIEDLRTDLLATQRLIGDNAAVIGLNLDRMRTFLHLADAENIPPLDSLLRLGGAFVGTPTPVPPLATYEAAIGSGEIALIQNRRFLTAMAEYRSVEARLERREGNWGESYYLGAHLELRRRLGSLGVFSTDLDTCNPNSARCHYPRALVLDSQEIVDLLREPEMFGYFESILNLLNSQHADLLRLDEAIDQALSAVDG